jgi:hypothetical protein
MLPCSNRLLCLSALHSLHCSIIAALPRTQDVFLFNAVDFLRSRDVDLAFVKPELMAQAQNAAEVGAVWLAVPFASAVLILIRCVSLSAVLVL